MGVERVLDVAAALDAERADDLERGVRSMWYSWSESVWLGATTRYRRCGRPSGRVLHVADGDAGIGAVANDAAAFARGLEQQRVWPTLKHFPGLGRATVSTDSALVRITASKAAIQTDLLPYKVALRRGLAPVVMLSTAV